VKEVFEKVKGTRDILSEEYREREELLEKAKRTLRSYGFDFIITPTFERTELFVRSIGETTDIVEKEMYTFLDRGRRSLTLRPEATAPVLRAYLENRMIPPVKLAYFMNMFRAEKPQKGRLREFWHLGVEVIGVENPLIDAEIVELGLKLLVEFGLQRVRIEINSIGTDEERKRYIVALREFLEPRKDELCEDCKRRLLRNPLRILDCKKDAEMLKETPSILDFLGEKSKAHFDEVLSYLREWGVEYHLNDKLVRGLDYYTRTTFEYKVEGLGAQDAVGGGGRYDRLCEELGGPPTPAIGFALGIERILLALGMRKEREGLDFFVVTHGEDGRRKGIELLRKMREKGKRVDISYERKSMKAQMKLASRLGSKKTIIIGEDEIKMGKIKIRDMATGEELFVNEEELLK